MAILGQGDLSPPRRHRSFRRYVMVLLVLAMLAGGGYAAYVGFIRGSSTHVGATPRLSQCAKRAAKPPYSTPRTLRVQIFNASLQTGLAAQVRSSLRHRGFRVTQIGNAMRVGHDVATVRYSLDEKLGSATLAAQVAGATTQQVSGQHVLELDLGLKFGQLRSATAAKTVARRVAATAAPTPSGSASPSC